MKTKNIILIIISCLALVSGSCRKNIIFYPVDDCKIVGKVWDGKLAWEEGYGLTSGNYYIVTVAFVDRCFYHMERSLLLEAELKKCREGKK